MENEFNSDPSKQALLKTSMNNHAEYKTTTQYIKRLRN